MCRPVVDMCEGLPGWEALNDCTALFETADTAPSGRFLDYPAEWGDSNSKRIEALDLDDVSIPSGGEGSLITEIRSAVEREAPLLLMFREPHWIHAQIDLQRVFLPEYFDGCRSRSRTRALGDCSRSIVDHQCRAGPDDVGD